MTEEFLLETEDEKNLGVPLRVGLFVPIFCSFLAKGFPLQSLTQPKHHKINQDFNINLAIEYKRNLKPGILAFFAPWNIPYNRIVSIK